MNLSPHFTLEAFTLSQWATRAGVDNTPSPAVVENLKRLAGALECVQAILNAPLVLSSVFRSDAVNRHVGGSSTSMHVLGLAADFVAPTVGTPFQVAKKLAASPDLVFDQLIHEYGRWVHFGLAIAGKPPRRQVLSVFYAGRYLPGLVEKAP